MRRRYRRLPLVAGVTAVLVAGCASGSDFGPGAPTPVPATDTPARFEPASPELRLLPGDTLAGNGCLSPMVDPRSGDSYPMVRSGSRQADYRVPAGRYGAVAGQLLRLECNTGRPVGLVRG